jgi:thioredoxin 1
LVDFFATWCGPCQMLLPVLNQVKESLQDRITIIKIDRQNQTLAQNTKSRSSYYDAFFKTVNNYGDNLGANQKEIIKIT